VSGLFREMATRLTVTDRGPATEVVA
jgi:hypothetical protein